MALKDLLVHVDSSKACAARVDAAVRLAETLDAHLTGLYVLPRVDVPAYIVGEVPQEVLAAQREAVLAHAVEAEKTFKASADKAGISVEWRFVENTPARTLILHARYVDLVIVGQEDRSDPLSASTGVAEEVVLDAGHPVLVIPYIGAPQPIGQRILVAWNTSREAVRAIHDALPLLERAKKVDVLSVNPPGGTAGDGDVPGADIALHLARHDVNAEATHIEAHDIDVGNMLLSRAADKGADLIVMGAYGHSRFRELVLGGATRHLLEHMTVPVLMSH
ncbi:MAG: universal stress protein [Acidiferrobacterales bacterium]